MIQMYPTEFLLDAGDLLYMIFPVVTIFCFEKGMFTDVLIMLACVIQFSDLNSNDLWRDEIIKSCYNSYKYKNIRAW